VHPRDRGRLKILIDNISSRWSHPYDQWCVSLWLATVAAKETLAQVHKARGVDYRKWKQDMLEGKRLVREAVKPGGLLDSREVKGMLMRKPPPEW